VPKAVGFGISSGEHAERIVGGGADGIIVGSALVDIVAEGVEDDLSTAEVADRLEALTGTEGGRRTRLRRAHRGGGVAVIAASSQYVPERNPLTYNCHTLTQRPTPS